MINKTLAWHEGSRKGNLTSPLPVQNLELSCDEAGLKHTEQVGTAWLAVLAGPLPELSESVSDRGHLEALVMRDWTFLHSGAKRELASQVGSEG